MINDSQDKNNQFAQAEITNQLKKRKMTLVKLDLYFHYFRY